MSSDVTLTLHFRSTQERDHFIRTHVELPWCKVMDGRIRVAMPTDYVPLTPAEVARSASL